MHALAGEDSFAIERISQSYLRWYQSLPFDISRTTSTGLSGGLRQPEGYIHRGMWKVAEQNNQGSKANGGLMRIAILGVWGARRSEVELITLADMDILQAVHVFREQI
jgi:hypothetical protein